MHPYRDDAPPDDPGDRDDLAVDVVIGVVGAGLLLCGPTGATIGAILLAVVLLSRSRPRPGVALHVLERVAACVGPVAAATAIGVLADAHLGLPDDAMLYLFAIMVAALGGRGAGLGAAALSVAAYDFFFIPPRFEFAVAEAHHFVTFAVMFAVGTAMGTLVVRLRRTEAASRGRERRTAALLAFTSDAASAKSVGDVTTAVAKNVQDVLGAHHGALDTEARELAAAIEQQAGVAIARLQLADEARAQALRAQAEELRSSLLSTVSHDLRTPLAIITGMATQLREALPDLPADQRESLDTIVDEARRLGNVLTNLLSITRVESGAELRRDWVPVEEIVGSALDRAGVALAGRDVAIALEPELGVVVDAMLTEQLLVNLLENAAKHTPAGTPIELSAAKDGERVAIAVSDRGPGLPAGSETRVFEKFFRGPGARVAGAGLGLAVCRGIAIAHGGDIRAGARDGGGATFRVWLPGGDPPALEATA
nr:DUF4118 domain-containing protein [Kofleriaceae bacterium]